MTKDESDAFGKQHVLRVGHLKERSPSPKVPATPRPDDVPKAGSEPEMMMPENDEGYDYGREREPVARPNLKLQVRILTGDAVIIAEELHFERGSVADEAAILHIYEQLAEEALALWSASPSRCKMEGS